MKKLITIVLLCWVLFLGWLILPCHAENIGNTITIRYGRSPVFVIADGKEIKLPADKEYSITSNLVLTSSDRKHLDVGMVDAQITAGKTVTRYKSVLLRFKINNSAWSLFWE